MTKPWTIYVQEMVFNPLLDKCSAILGFKMPFHGQKFVLSYSRPPAFPLYSQHTYSMSPSVDLGTKNKLRVVKMRANVQWQVY